MAGLQPGKLVKGRAYKENPNFVPMKWKAPILVCFSCIFVFVSARSHPANCFPLSDSAKDADTSKHKTPLHITLQLDAGEALPLGTYSVNYVEYLSSAGNSGTRGFRGEGGFAVPGPSVVFTAECLMHNPYWGIQGRIGYYRNGFDMGDYANGYSFNSSACYNSFTIMPGLFAGFSNENVALQFRVSAGVMLCRSPDLQYSGDSVYPDFKNSVMDTASISRELKPSVTAAFAFSAGIGLKFKLHADWALSLDADYVQAFPAFSISSVFVKNGATYSSVTDVYNPVSLLNISIGIGYCF
jgi:hypothetical protein